VKGRKRHILVDTQGLVLKALVHSAAIADRDGGRLLLEQGIAQQFPRIRHLWVVIEDALWRG
jgi:transposase